MEDMACGTDFPWVSKVLHETTVENTMLKGIFSIGAAGVNGAQAEPG